MKVNVVEYSEPLHWSEKERYRGICKPGDTARAATFQSPMRGTIGALTEPISKAPPPPVKIRGS